MKADLERSPREHLIEAVLFLRRALRARRWGALAFALGLAISALATATAKRRYQSEAVMVFDRDVGLGAIVAEADVDSPRQLAARLQDMLFSPQRLERAVGMFGLYPNIVGEHGVPEAVGEMRKHLKLTAREGYSFRLTFESVSRDLAQKVLDWLANDLIEEDTTTRHREAQSTKAFLDGERVQADRELGTREAALSAFLVTHPMLAAESLSGASPGGIKRADNAAVANPGAVVELEMKARQLEELLARATSERPGETAAATASPEERAAAENRSRAQAAVESARRELADKRVLFTDEHPDVRNAQRRLLEAEDGLRRADADIGARPATAAPPTAGPDDPSGSERVRGLRRMLAEVRGQIAALRDRTERTLIPPTSGAKRGGVDRDTVAIETEWTRLYREVSEARERQNHIEQRQLHADLYATLVSSGGAGRLTIVDPAFRPLRPVAGRRTTVALLGAAGSLALALMVMLAFAYLDERLYSTRDVRSVIGDQFVILVPALPGAERKLVGSTR